MSHPIQVGDVVSLKGSSVLVTVERIMPWSVNCKWFDERKQLRTATFLPNELGEVMSDDRVKAALNFVDAIRCHLGHSNKSEVTFPFLGTRTAIPVEGKEALVGFEWLGSRTLVVSVKD